MELVEWNKMVPSLPLLFCELSVSVKENPDRKKKNAIKEKIIRDIKTLFQSLEEEYYEALTIGNKFSNYYIQYESNGNRK